MILVDTNIIMYAAGADDPHRAESLALLRRVAAGEVDAAVNAEVLQEILHRYRSIRRWEQGLTVYQMSRKVFDVVLPVTAAVVDRARQLLTAHAALLARDAVHAAVVEIEGLEGICSFDRDLDRVRGLRRLLPSAA